MADEGRVENRARAGTRTWPVARARRAWDGIWPQAEFAVPARIREWATIEVGVGRLLPWFAVAYGAGIVLYFTAEREPALWAAGSLTALCALAAVLLRRQIVPYVVALGAFGIAQSQINPDADILTERPGLSTMSLMQLTSSPPCTSSSNTYACPPRSCVASPPIQEVSQLPSGTSAPNTVITEHAITTLRLQSSITTAGWLITSTPPLPS